MRCDYCKRMMKECYPAEGKAFCSVRCKLQHITGLVNDLYGEIEDCGRLDTIDGMRDEIRRLEKTYDIEVNYD